MRLEDISDATFAQRYLARFPKKLPGNVLLQDHNFANESVQAEMLDEIHFMLRTLLKKQGCRAQLSGLNKKCGDIAVDIHYLCRRCGGNYYADDRLKEAV